MRLRAAVITVALACCAIARPAAAQTGAQAPAGDSIVLRFGWKDGIEAQVQYTQTIDRQGDSDQPTHIEVEGEYTMHVHDHPSGLLLEHLDPVVIRFRASPSLPADDPRQLVYSTIGSPIADWVVSKDGKQVVQIQGLQALTAAIGQSVQKQAPGADADAVIGQLANPDVLLSVARERWGNQVGDWIGAALRKDEVLAGEGSEANPIVPALQVSYQYEFKLDSIEACAAPGGKCARVEISQFYDPVALNKTMNDALVQMGMGALSFDGLAEESRMILLTDPNTLLPYQMDMTKGVEGILKINGEDRIFRRTDEISLDYTYTKR